MNEELKKLTKQVEEEIKPQFKEIDEICETTGRNRNEIIQLCLEFAVENIEIEK